MSELQLRQDELACEGYPIAGASYGSVDRPKCRMFLIKNSPRLLGREVRSRADVGAVADEGRTELAPVGAPLLRVLSALRSRAGRLASPSLALRNLCALVARWLS